MNKPLTFDNYVKKMRLSNKELEVDKDLASEYLRYLIVNRKVHNYGTDNLLDWYIREIEGILKLSGFKISFQNVLDVDLIKEEFFI